jgi:hypothetical protein
VKDRGLVWLMFQNAFVGGPNRYGADCSLLL